MDVDVVKGGAEWSHREKGDPRHRGDSEAVWQAQLQQTADLFLCFPLFVSPQIRGDHNTILIPINPPEQIEK